MPHIEIGLRRIDLPQNLTYSAYSELRFLRIALTPNWASCRHTPDPTSLTASVIATSMSTSVTLVLGFYDTAWDQPNFTCTPKLCTLVPFTCYLYMPGNLQIF